MSVDAEYYQCFEQDLVDKIIKMKLLDSIMRDKKSSKERRSTEELDEEGLFLTLKESLGNPQLLHDLDPDYILEALKKGIIKEQEIKRLSHKNPYVEDQFYASISYLFKEDLTSYLYIWSDYPDQVNMQKALSKKVRVKDIVDINKGGKNPQKHVLQKAMESNCSDSVEIMLSRLPLEYLLNRTFYTSAKNYKEHFFEFCESNYNIDYIELVLKRATTEEIYMLDCHYRTNFIEYLYKYKMSDKVEAMAKQVPRHDLPMFLSETLIVMTYSCHHKLVLDLLRKADFCGLGVHELGSTIANMSALTIQNIHNKGYYDPARELKDDQIRKIYKGKLEAHKKGSYKPDPSHLFKVPAAETLKFPNKCDVAPDPEDELFDGKDTLYKIIDDPDLEKENPIIIQTQKSQYPSGLTQEDGRLSESKDVTLQGEYEELDSPIA